MKPTVQWSSTIFFIFSEKVQYLKHVIPELFHVFSWAHLKRKKFFINVQLHNSQLYAHIWHIWLNWLVLRQTACGEGRDAWWGDRNQQGIKVGTFSLVLIKRPTVIYFSPMTSVFTISTLALFSFFCSCSSLLRKNNHFSPSKSKTGTYNDIKLYTYLCSQH